MLNIRLPQTVLKMRMHTFLVSQFLWVRSQDRAHCILCFRVSHEAAIKVSARAGVSSEGSKGEESASELTWFLATLGSSGLLD